MFTWIWNGLNLNYIKHKFSLLFNTHWLSGLTMEDIIYDVVLGALVLFIFLLCILLLSQVLL